MKFKYIAVLAMAVALSGCSTLEKFKLGGGVRYNPETGKIEGEITVPVEIPVGPPPAPTPAPAPATLSIVPTRTVQLEK